MVGEAVYYAVHVRRLRPEDQDVLVEFPRVERVVQRVSKVRPPQGFALSQARQQARKVHMLHAMLKVGENTCCGTVHETAVGPRPRDGFLFAFQNFLVYMFFLLVVLLLNYSDSDKDAHSLRLRTQLRRALHTPEYRNISRYPLAPGQRSRSCVDVEMKEGDGHLLIVLLAGAAF